MDRRRAKALIKMLAVVAVIVFSALIFYETLTTNLFLERYGLVGIFLSALFSHMTIFARGLFLPLFLSLTQIYKPPILGLTAGSGGALGELAAYYWGRGIKEFLESPERRNEKPLPKTVEKYGLLLALVFASSPLPDTPMMILAGSLRFPLWKLAIIQIVGKTILYSAGAIVGGFVFMELKSTFEETTASIIVLLASIALCIIVSWSKSRNVILKILNKVLDKLGVKSNFYI